MNKFFSQFPCKINDDFSVIIDDNGIVAYAYLMFQDQIISDVWLYNKASTPLVTQWEENEMPFLNPIEFIDIEKKINPIERKNDVSIRWDMEGSVPTAIIYIRGDLTVVLSKDAFPGWSKVVKKDGPLALKM